MRRVRSAALVGSFLLLAACSGSASPSLPQGGGAPLTVPSASTSPSPSAESPSASASESAPASASTAPTAVKPCHLLTNDQASQVNGVTYGDGTEHQLEHGLMQCTWANTSVHASVVVQVVLASGVTQAEADYAAAQAQNNGFAVERLTGFGDDAAIARAPSNIKTGGIYVRKGDTVFDVVYLAGTAPSDDQLKAAATTILGELP